MTDSVYLLKPATIIALPYNTLLDINKHLVLDSIILLTGLNQNLGDFLQNQSQVFIKNYGPGQLASLSMRGGSAHHTPLLWNGFNLQNPMLGQVDLSLFPAFFFNRIQINYGSNSGLFGSGAIGGNINIETTQNFDNIFSGKIIAGYHSNNVYTSGASINLKHNKIFGGLKLLYAGGPNNYTFLNDFKKPNIKENANHAAFNQYALLANIGSQISNQSSLQFHTWVQQSSRKIQPPIATANTFPVQDDAAKRFMLDYKFEKSRYRLQIRNGTFFDEINYSSLATPLSQSKTLVQTIFTDQYFSIKSSLLHVGTMYQYEQVNATAMDNKHRNRVALFTSYRWYGLNHKLTQQIILRQETADGQLLPFIPNYNAELVLSKQLKIMANVSRVFRLPTFNDLYWPVLGNINLKPEEGWCTELSSELKYNGIGITATLYHKNISNWIIWIPDENGLFRPQNIKKVWSRGAEANWNLKVWEGYGKITASGLHDFNLATDEKEKQLIFTPRLRHNFNFGWQFKNFNFTINHRYTGVSFSSNDHTSWLMPFNITNVYASYFLILKNNKSLHTQLACNNVFNKHYMYIPARPMPLINYQINLTLNF
ncbi:MAG: TonB-dependent receptor plug domain-containing protein [Bacteroidia bacterium]